MDEVFEISMMLDFYGQLITKRQYEIMDLHYNHDYTLAEIAEHLKISRQGVYDNIRKAKTTLNSYEKKLNLVERHLQLKSKIINIIKRLDAGLSNMQDSENNRMLANIANDLRELIDS